MQTRTAFRSLVAAGLAAALSAGVAAAETIEVKMLNRGSDGEIMVFEPAVIQANVGDTIVFLPTDKGHNAATETIPEGQESVTGRINQEVEYEVTADGVHLIKCTPHYALGMIAVIVAGGDTSNIEEVADTRMGRKAQQRLETYLAQAREMTGS